MIRKLIFPLLILITGFTALTSTQKPSNINELTEKIITWMEYYVNEIPEEKVFLHLDKSMYAAGDNIWYAVYLTAGSPDIPSPLSKTVYVDLLDNEGKLLQQKTILMEEGHGHGDFKLDFYAKEGLYHIKAYSHWLKGFGEDAVYHTTVQVLEPFNLSFQPNVKFETVETANSISYKTSITALGKTLQPIADRTISYEVIDENNQALMEGKFVTDLEGKALVEFQLDQAKLSSLAVLRLVYQENEDYLVTRNFPLPFPISAIDIQFLPEGGDLIAGFNNKVAVRAVQPDGKPVTLTGTVEVEGQEIAFTTDEAGLGAFSITPTAGKKYKAKINILGQNITKALPEIKAQGVNLAVDNSNPLLVNMLIQGKDFTALSPNGEGLLVVHARGRIGHMQVINLTNGVAGARINKSQLAPGINQVTIFEPEGTALAERLIFIPQAENIEVSLKQNNTSIAPRSKNQWQIAIEGESFEAGNYSVAITDANELPSGFATNIHAYLKLESELKGKIHNPNQLLGKESNLAAIDLVMLTHGWRRFNWEQLLAGDVENKNFIEQGINITGTVQPKSGKRGLSGGMLNIFSKGEEDNFMAVEFGENGKFIIDDMLFKDTTQLTITGSDKRHRESIELQLDPPLAKYVQWEGFKPQYKAFESSQILRDYLAAAEKQRQASSVFDEMDMVDIEEFVLKSQKYDEVADEIDRIYGKGDQSLNPEDIGGFEGYTDIWQLLQGRFAGVQVKPSPMGGAPSITIRGQGSLNAIQPIILLDNTPVDATFVSSISPRDIAAIDIFKEGATLAIFGSGGAGGAIAIYTKRGSGVYEESEGTFNLRFPGYSTSRKYYMPRYDQENSPKPDYRSTLYWNPKVKLENNLASIEFFNSDVAQKYRIVLQGMDKLGRVTYFEQEIEP